jgi:molecular chaperone GrpE
LLAEEENASLDGKVSQETTTRNLESLEQLLAQEKEKAERHLANWQRTEADFRNYKAREEQEKQEIVNWANSKLVSDILPVLDAFDRAFEGVAAKAHHMSWITGFKQIRKMLLDALVKHGLEEVKSVGEMFDPSRHEAVAQQGGPEGRILSEVRKGYILKDKLIRAPQVVVGNGGETPSSEPAQVGE